MGRVVVIANQKGGVGKTTTAVNLSACMARGGARTVLIDIDPQGNATSGVGVVKNDLAYSVYHALVEGKPLAEVVQPTAMEKLAVVPANKDLVGAEIELVEQPRREFRLRELLDPFKTGFDYVFIDCPPSLGLLTLNGLVAADGLLITLQCEYYALEGLTELLRTVSLVRENLNPTLRLDGVLLTMHQHTNLSRQVIDDVRAYLGPQVYETVIPRNVTLSEAPSFGQPVIDYDLKSQGARAYLALAREVVSRG